MPRKKRAFVYILCCADGTLYTGFTTDLERRVNEHQRGRGGRYTRIRTPIALVYFEALGTRRAAMKREIAIKRLSRPQKQKLIASTNAPIPNP